MIIKLNQFRGIAPRIAPVDLPEPAAQTAINCLFGSGSLRPLVADGSITVANPLAAGTVKSIYRYTGDKWLSWITDVNTCKSSVARDAFDRLYWTGDGAPKISDNTKITGAAVLPTGSWPLGISKPPTAITATAAAASGNVTDTTHAYVYTYVSVYGEEGPPSAPSASITISAGATITVSGMTVPGGQIASINIYRSNTGSDATMFQFLVSRTVSTAYPDSTTDANLGVVLPSATWTAPNTNMQGLISHPGGFLVGFYNNVLCFSEPYLPHAWPASYQISVDDTIVAIGAFGNSILVATTGMPLIITGSAPGQLSKEKLEKGEACILKRGLVDMGSACVFPGPSGLWLVGTGAVELATKQLMTKLEWQPYIDATTGLKFAVQYESKYIGFMSSGGFVFDTATGDFSLHDITATGGWYDPETGKLYLIVGNVIKEWAGGANKSLTWKSKKFRLPSPVNLGASQIFASGTVTAKIYADGVLKHTQTAANSNPFRLPSGFRAHEWEVEVTGTSEVTAIYLASTISELAQV